MRSQEFRNVTLTGGFNAIENNNGSQFPTLQDLDFKNPFFFMFEGRFSEPFAVQVKLFTNELELRNGTDPFFFGGQVNAQWYFDQHIFNNEDFEWSVGGGLGVNKAQRRSSQATYGFNTLFRYWFSERWAVSFQGDANFGFGKDDQIRNFYQYSFGIVWGSKVKRPERNAYLESRKETEQEDIYRERESVVVDLTPDEEPEEEVEEVVEAEPQEEMKEPEPISLTSIYFDRNSSYFSTEESRKLDRVIVTLQARSNTRVRVEAYTDASGDANYNQWLADRRLKRTIDYVLEAGIDPTRIEGFSIGIDPESVECIDVPSPCSVESQRIYRRTQFMIFEE
jgi:outer membrane protein OmpA-like peptidoglycan-associated protein